jgi:hypothetical protein
MLVNSAEAVAQAVQTRLRLATQDWFLDLTEGTPYFPSILGHGTNNSYDTALQSRILETPGVIGLEYYQSSLDADTRRLTVVCQINTIYGDVTAVIGAVDTNPPQSGRLDSTFILDESVLM